MRDYQLIRSQRRSLALEIRELRLIVRAPMGLPREDIDRFVRSRESWIAGHLEQQSRRMAAHPEPDEAEKKKYIAMARRILPEKVAQFAAIMGLQPTGLWITGAKTRFGSCTSKGKLNFSWRLMQYPEAAIDYVVVHELAHLRHMDHSREFYAVVESVLPDYRERRKLLKE